MTFSIIGRDAVDGTMGVGSQSHFFAVGSVVGRAEPGVGAVVSQAFANVDWSHEGLAMLRAGLDSREVVRELRSSDSLSAFRQLAVMDAAGEINAFTGGSCVPCADVVVGDGVVAVGNMLSSETTCMEMVSAYESSAGGLADRLLQALDAGERAGGDARGSQSAYLQIVDDVRSDRPWRHVQLDIRVDDHPDPVAELRRLLPIHGAFSVIGAALFAPPMVIGDMSGGIDPGEAAVMLAALEQASVTLGANREAEIWRAVILMRSGEIDAGRRALADLVEERPELASFIDGLGRVGIVGEASAGAS